MKLPTRGAPNSKLTCKKHYPVPSDERQDEIVALLAVLGVTGFAR